MSANSPLEIQAETARLETLERFCIMDTPPEPAFDRVTRLVCAIFKTPMANITLIDGHRQWFKSRIGMDDAETDRGPAMCYAAIRTQAMMVVPDTRLDPRFRDNPFVTGAPHVRFYAGAPLRMPNDAIIGTLCCFDMAPRTTFGVVEAAILSDLAGIIVDEIARRPVSSDDAAPPETEPQPTMAPATTPAFRRVLKAGRIAFNGGRSMVDCTIRGLNDNGALVSVISTAGIPDTFKLAILADNTSRAGRVVSKREGNIEIAFE